MTYFNLPIAKWTWLAVFLWLYANPSQAQNQTPFYYCDFENGADDWYVQKNNGTIELYPSGGRYIIDRKDTKLSTFVSEGIFIDNTKPFKVSMEAMHISGVDNVGYGFQLHNKDRKQHVSLLITQNGYFKITANLNGESTNLTEYKKTDLLKPGESNQFAMAYDGAGSLVAYLNHTQVAQVSQTIPFSIQNLSIILYRNQKIAFDNIKVFQDRKIKLADGIPESIEKENLGKNVNSEAAELLPIISSDGRYLYYTRQHHPSNVVKGKQDPWFCELQSDGTWSEAQKMKAPVSNKNNNAILSVMPDNNTMLVLNKYFKDGSVSQGLSITKRSSDGWLFPEAVDVKNYYNDSKFGEYFLTSDQQHIIMAVERKDTYGERDLYISHRQDDGSYTEPKNLGKVLNTAATEMGPFLAADGRTLYYSSKGLPGYGNADIFITRRIGEGWEQWTEPRNLGLAINTRSFDAFFRIDAEGRYAYMSSTNNSMGRSDIVRMELPLALRPNPVALVKGRVYDKKTNDPLGTTIFYFDLETGQKMGQANSAPSNGAYQIVLPTGKRYGFNAEKDNYYPVSENLDLRNLTEYAEVERNLPLVPLEAQTTIRLNNLFFDYDKYELLAESKMELDRLYKILEKYPAMTIEVQGHTDSDGSDSYNQTLSANRAKAVYDYLAKTKQVKLSRLSYKGYGEKQPVASNDTDEGKQQNRRVEFKILSLK